MAGRPGRRWGCAVNEIEKYEPNEVEVRPSDLVDTPLLRWAQEARQANMIAQSLANTSFVSSQFRGKPSEITAAILTGQEMGLSPMSALRSIDIIQGTPAIRAHAMRGLVQSRGHKIQVKEASPQKVVVHGRRAGEDEVHESVWTIDRAERMGLTGKDTWKRQPQAMLVARATSECCRLTASDVLLGMPYSAEELADVDGETEKVSKRRTVKRKAKPEAAPIPEPELTAELGESVTVDEELPEMAGDRDE